MSLMVGHCYYLRELGRFKVTQRHDLSTFVSLVLPTQAKWPALHLLRSGDIAETHVHLESDYCHKIQTRPEGFL